MSKENSIDVYLIFRSPVSRIAATLLLVKIMSVNKKGKRWCKIKIAKIILIIQINVRKVHIHIQSSLLTVLLFLGLQNIQLKELWKGSLLSISILTSRVTFKPLRVVNKINLNQVIISM